MPDVAQARPPQTRSWRALRQAALKCTACPLYRKATQTVFGEGPVRAPLFLVGEQPGNLEDLEGRPFVGPAGQLLDRALAEAGIDREKIYLTNAVKHFKWEALGKRRLHHRPSSRELRACHPWLEAELALVRPRVVVGLGATAAAALLGSKIRVTRDRGKAWASAYCEKTFVTVHPSSLLRAPSPQDREKSFRRFVRDLQTAAAAL